MKVHLLSPAGALSLAGLFVFLSWPLASPAGDPAATPVPSPEGSLTFTPAASLTQAVVPTSTPSLEPTSETPTLVPSQTSTVPTTVATPSETAVASETPLTSPSPLASLTASPSPDASTTPQTATEPPGSATPLSSASPSATSISSSTVTPAGSSPATLTPSASPVVPPTAYPPQSVLINEVAWAGTVASSSDEWIELQNLTSSAIDLGGWRLTDGGDINISLTGSLPAYSYFLLERTDDSTIADIAASQTYTGSLANGGERLELIDPSGGVVDTANSDGGGWPAGDAASRRSMERRGGSDNAGNWGTFTGYGGVGTDATGSPIAGTPRQLNSVLIATPTPSPVVHPTEVPSQSVLINEVAWAGTLASSSDEWIELHNTSGSPISLAGWKLTDGSDLTISLSGTIAAHSYFLLERTDDTTVSDIAADVIYSGGLNNGGESLELRGPVGELVDSANASGGGWPAGSSASKASMERRGGGDISGNWGTFTGYNGNGRDASGTAIQGTPRRTNSLFFPTPTPTVIPSRIVINEVLIRPRHDWEGAGGVTTGDEFIELYNAGPLPVYLKGWWLDDVAGSGSAAYDLPGVTISPRGYAVFFRTKTKIALNDSGDTVRLLAPDGRKIDQISYLRIRAANLSYGRLPNGSDNMRYGLWPTPGKANLLFTEPRAPPDTRIYFGQPCTGRSLTLLTRATRFPSQMAWLQAMYFVGCEIELPTGRDEL